MTSLPSGGAPTTQGAAAASPRASGLAVHRLPALALGGVGMIGGLWAALIMLDIPMPGGDSLTANHGPLMVLGFLGTLIALERSVALGTWWGYLAPVGAGVGGVAIVLGLPDTAAYLLMSGGGTALVVMYAVFYRRQPAPHIAIEGAGSVAWYGATLVLLADRPVAEAVPWFAAFLVLTIGGERLELSRMAMLSPRAKALLVIAAAPILIGALVSTIEYDAGFRITGLGLVTLTSWLARYDIARRTVRVPGVTRFMATALLSGYVWLGTAGVLWLGFGDAGTVAVYDSQLHALFLGFVISMVIGHAPVILPAVLRRPLPYAPRLYGPWALLHSSLVIRIVGGDLLDVTLLWQVGGVLNVTAVLFFVGLAAYQIVRAPTRRNPPRRQPVAAPASSQEITR